MSRTTNIDTAMSRVEPEPITDLVLTYPLPFLALVTVALVVTVLLWRVVLSAVLTASGLWTLGAHGDNGAALVAALCVLICAALLAFQPTRTARRPLRLRREEVAG